MSVIEMDEAGCEEVASSLWWVDERDVIVMALVAPGMGPASRLSLRLSPVVVELRTAASPPMSLPESAGFSCATAFFLRVNANLRFGAEALRISCRFS